MGYDKDLADRMRRVIGEDPALTEKKMFGGLAFLIGGNMAIAASSDGGAMVRVDPEQSDALVAATTATVVEMRGRQADAGVAAPQLGRPAQRRSAHPVDRNRHRFRPLATAQTLAGPPIWSRQVLASSWILISDHDELPVERVVNRVARSVSPGDLKSGY